MTALEVRNIQKNYGKTEVLKDISFSLEKGQVLAIIGSSGSGKTTLLRCLNFLETPQEGSIVVNGKTIFDAASAFQLTDEQIRENRLHFGLVFQSFNLFPQYNVLQNVTLAPTLLKLGTAQEIQEKAKKLIAQVGLSERIQAYPCQLSGGQQQRVAIARALASEAPVILADEPTGDLDEETAQDIAEILKRSAHQMKKCVIVVTHSGELAKQADVVFRLKKGELQIEQSGKSL